MQTRLSHVALLVPSVDQTAEILRPQGLTIGPAESFEGEGTREIYVGDMRKHSGLLLLMQGEKPGAYTRAMAKRGPGLHHIAIDILDMNAFMKEIAGSGWLLHPKSVESMREYKTAYLARPGMPMLIEVHERESLTKLPSLVTEIAVRLPERGLEMISALGLKDLVRQSSGEPSIAILQQRVRLAELLS